MVENREEKMALAKVFIDLGYSQRQVAKKLGVTKTTVRRWTNEEAHALSLEYNNRPEVRQKVAEWHKSEAGKAYMAKYHRRADRKQKRAEWHKSEAGKASKARYRRTPKYLQYSRDYKRQRYHNDTEFRLSVILRARLGIGLRNGSAVRDLGCTVAELKTHLENQFQPGMSWENHGEWHIDHIRPLASFDLTDRDQFLQAANYKNLQPLWAADNLKKADTWVK